MEVTTKATEIVFFRLFKQAMTETNRERCKQLVSWDVPEGDRLQFGFRNFFQEEAGVLQKTVVTKSIADSALVEGNAVNALKLKSMFVELSNDI